MTTTLSKLIVDQNRADQYPLYGDIAEELGEVGGIPDDLADFNRPVGNNEAREVGMDVFLTEKHLAQTGRSPAIRIKPPCAEYADLFNPEWPAEEDFPEGSRSPGYQRQCRRAELEMANAKRICMTACPLPVRRACLLKALEHDREYEALPEVVAGGYGDGGRAKIDAQLQNIKRRYERGIKEDAGRGRVGAKESGMPREEREELERLALTIEVAS